MSDWTKAELRRVLELYVRMNGKGIHKLHKLIIELANELQRPVRGVENQLLMFRALQRGGEYGRTNMSALCRELWEEIGSGAGKQGRLPLAAEEMTMQVAGAENGEKSPVNATVTALMDRSHGGSGAAVVPGLLIEDNLPATQPPAGVRELINRLHHRMVDGTDAISDWVFLVGGPGNGKSFQVASLVARLQQDGVVVDLDAGHRARRVLPTISSAGQHLSIVNDATIRPHDRPAAYGHLTADLLDASRFSPTANLLVNVNRGVLIEELAEIVSDEEHSAYRSLLSWLVSPRRSFDRRFLKDAGDESVQFFYRSAIFSRQGESATARVHVVGLDLLSLLELVPSNSNGDAIADLDTSTPVCSPYKVMAFDDVERWNSPLGRLLKDVTSAQRFEDGPCGTCAANHYCPVLANAKMLRPSAAGRGLLTTFRASEIASARLFTYRDAWSLLATAIIGPKRSDFAGQPVCDWVRAKAKDITSNDQSTKRRAIIDLHLQRTQHALFPVKLPSRGFCGAQSWRIETPAALPATENLWLVDPARETSGGWAGCVNNAMEGWDFDESPLALLKADDPAIAQVIGSIDQVFENLLRSWACEPRVKEVDRREHLRWLGVGYYRLVSLMKARPATTTLAKEWIIIHDHVSQNREHIIDSELHNGLQNLLFPEYPTSGLVKSSFLPLFAARIEPIQRAQDRSVLCVAVPREGQHAVSIHYEAIGDALWIVIRSASANGNEELARLPLDHYTCREAIVSSKGKGFTEAGTTSVPRIERVRASLVSASSKAHVLVLVGNSVVAASKVSKVAGGVL